jgi:hypothetical protein
MLNLMGKRQILGQIYDRSLQKVWNHKPILAHSWLLTCEIRKEKHDGIEQFGWQVVIWRHLSIAHDSTTITMHHCPFDLIAFFMQP